MMKLDRKFYAKEFLRAAPPVAPKPRIRLRSSGRLRQYLHDSTIHSLRYIADGHISLFERCFYAMAVVVAIIYGTWYISELYDSWSERPVIISQANSAHIKNIPFPAVTVCNVNQARGHRVKSIRNGTFEEFLLKNICRKPVWKEFNSTFRDFQQFLQNVSQSCANMLTLCSFNLERQECTQLFRTTVTDLGQCCTFNAIHPRFLVRGEFQWQQDMISGDEEISKSMPVDWCPERGYPRIVTNTSDFYPRSAITSGKSYGLTIVLQADKSDYPCSPLSIPGFIVLLHDPTDVPRPNDFGFQITPGTVNQAVVEAHIVNSSESVSRVPPRDRRCHLPGEFRLLYFRRYSRRNCQRELQSRTMEAMCGCVLFSMPLLHAGMRICASSRQNCYIRMIQQLARTDQEDQCLPSCTEIEYKAVSMSSMSSNGSKFLKGNQSVLRVYYESSLVDTYQREPYIGFTEFLSNTGGILGLMMGVSLMSVAELFDHFVIRPICQHLQKNRQRIQPKHPIAHVKF